MTVRTMTATEVAAAAQAAPDFFTTFDVLDIDGDIVVEFVGERQIGPTYRDYMFYLKDDMGDAPFLWFFEVGDVFYVTPSLDTALGLLREALELGVWVGDRCFFCSAWNDEHAPDCWVERAKALLEGTG